MSCLIVLATLGGGGEGVPCTRRGCGSKGSKTLCSGVESPEDFPGGREKDARCGRSSASGHPLIRFSLPVSSFLSLEGLKPAEGELRRSEGPRAGRKHGLVSSLGPCGRAGVSGVNSPNSGFLPQRGRSQGTPCGEGGPSVYRIV